MDRALFSDSSEWYSFEDTVELTVEGDLQVAKWVINKVSAVFQGLRPRSSQAAPAASPVPGESH